MFKMSEMEQLARVEVILDELHRNPSCPHGPTLLFKRVVNGTERSFFACSACRDRKDCSFFLWADEKVTPNKKKAWDLEREISIPKINHVSLYKKFVLLLEKSSEQRAFCHTCNTLLLSSEIAKNHVGHDVKINISEHLLRHPSELLRPLESSKKEAQYLFSSHATRTIVNMACGLGAKKVLCMGTPRVHELVCSEMSSEMDSLLLDIDHRFHQFNSPAQFCWFNSFNNYLFSQEESAHVLAEFLRDGGEGIVLVMDPPFGGRVEPLAKTVQEIMQLHRKLCPSLHTDMLVLWIFPYFMEPQILASCPDFTMLDYKVDYDNHSLFASAGHKGRKHGSPVRIFTNASPKNIPLPREEGYRYCEICEWWVSEENRHCMKCNKCSSKDGRSYVHCNECMRCVKPSWQHCTTCDRCCLPSHVCGEFVPSQLCFNCGQPGHKKRDCPSFSFDAAISIKKLDFNQQLNSMKTGKKRKRAQNNMIDGKEKKEVINVSRKKQKLKIVNGKRKARINMRKRRKPRVNTSMKPRLQL